MREILYVSLSAFDRIQQLQLLGRQDMTGDARDRLWSQLEAEILVQRHKTVMRAVRQRDHPSPPHKSRGCVRTVTLRRGPDQGLGISITVREISATLTSFQFCIQRSCACVECNLIREEQPFKVTKFRLALESTMDCEERK